MRSVFPGRIEQDRHLIEGHPLRCFSLNAPHDLNAFTWFARPAVNPETLIERINRRSRVLKKMLLRAGERVCVIILALTIVVACGQYHIAVAGGYSMHLSLASQRFLKQRNRLFVPQR